MKLEGCFETMLYVDGHIPLLKYHMQRLERSLNYLNWEHPEGLSETSVIDAVRKSIASSVVASIPSSVVSSFSASASFSASDSASDSTSESVSVAATEAASTSASVAATEAVSTSASVAASISASLLSRNVNKDQTASPEVIPEQRFRVRLALFKRTSEVENDLQVDKKIESEKSSKSADSSSKVTDSVSWEVEIQSIEHTFTEYKLGVIPITVPVFPADESRACKLSNRQTYTKAFELARSLGYDDALIVLNDLVSETAIANLIWLKDGELFTSSEDSGALKGISLDFFRMILDTHGIRIQEKDITMEELVESECIWMINAVRGPIPIAEINGRKMNFSQEWDTTIQKKYWDGFYKQIENVGLQKIRFVRTRNDLLKIVQRSCGESRISQNVINSGRVDASSHNGYSTDKTDTLSQNVIFLDSQLPEHPSSERSYVFADFFRTITYADGIATIRSESGSIISELKTDPWHALEQFRNRYPGYQCGYLGYDLKNYTEELLSVQTDPIGLPEMWMGYPGMVYVLDTSGNEEKSSGLEPTVHPRIMLDRITDRDTYIEKVKRAKEYIHDGDIYEVNLSHQIVAGFVGDPLQLYETMRERGPVPYAAFMYLDGISISCASPERFLRKSGDRVISDPIKGTRPRGQTDLEDQHIREQLQSSEKDKAENLMIVDLVRNDLSRVCRPGSVKVTSLFEIQSFGTVHQMVSRVEGEVIPSIRSEQILSSCFPMGSMTGAPKIRAMEVIDELETYRRGLYSGAIGFFEPDGDFNFNVVIRSAIIRGNTLWYAAGGAITSDSDPEQEWDETLVKIRALGNFKLGAVSR